MWFSDFLFFLPHFNQIKGQSECWENYQCQLATITVSTADVECYGYYSCTNAVSIEITSNGSIECYGSYSCYNSDSIQRITSTYSLYV